MIVVTHLPLPSKLLKVLQSSTVVALCGAGVSTASGIPDYRGKDGLWVRSPKALEGAHISSYLASAELRERAWMERLTSPYRFASPNEAHFILQRLVLEGRISSIVTQNVDGLQSQAGTTSDYLMEVHGNLRKSLCLSCGNTQDMETTLLRVKAGNHDPRCETITETGPCGGILKSTAISFGQALDPVTMNRAQKAFESSEVILVLGSSLTVNPIAANVERWRRAGKVLVIVNLLPTRYDEVADFVVRADVADVLRALAESSPSSVAPESVVPR